MSYEAAVSAGAGEKKRVAVIGAGIVGLNTALVLSQNNFAVTVFTDQDPLKTTSIAAGAICMAYKTTGDKVDVWSTESRLRYEALAKEDGSGVSMCNCTVLFPEFSEQPDWLKSLPEGAAPTFPVSATDFPCSYSVTVPVIDPYRHVNYLLHKLEVNGVSVVTRKIEALEELAGDFGIIVNATGVSAKDLAHDESVYPIKGQTVALAQPTERITEAVIAMNRDGSGTLVIPHTDYVKVGVTVREGDSSPDYDYEAEKILLGIACAFFPQLASTEIKDRRVGFRPGRKDGICLDIEQRTSSTGTTFLCCSHYGHGGGGFTTAPASARELVQNITRTLAA